MKPKTLILWVSKVLLGAWVAFMIMSVAYLLSSHFSSGGHPNLLGTKLLVVLGESMAPSFKKGDLVAVTAIDPASARAGDVITFLGANPGEGPGEGRLVTHRVVGFISQGGTVYYKTKGDNNEAEDAGLVRPEAVLGRVTLTIPRGGYVADFIKSLPGLFTFIVLPGIVLMLGELREVVRIMREPGANGLDRVS